MFFNDHYIGFEKEEYYSKVFAEVRRDCPSLKPRTFRKIVKAINPDFAAGLSEPRKCVRKLRYVGGKYFENPVDIEEHDFFKVGNIYTAIDFNGATYTIEGYRNGEEARIGCAYFEVVNQI